MQARYYDPVIGRFLSPDPVTFAEGGTGYFNRYAYVRGDPVNMVDPDGRQGRPPGSYGDLIGAGFGDAEARSYMERNAEVGLSTLSFANDLFNPLSDVGTFLADPSPLTFAIMAAGALPGPNVGGKVFRALPSGLRAESSVNSALLSKHADLVNRYGSGGVRELADGRIRYYDLLKSADKPGRTVGLRRVKEWDPSSGQERVWFESLNSNGRVIQVRPETGGPKVHYMFDDQGNYTGKW